MKYSYSSIMTPIFFSKSKKENNASVFGSLVLVMPFSKGQVQYETEKKKGCISTCSWWNQKEKKYIDRNELAIAVGMDKIRKYLTGFAALSISGFPFTIKAYNFAIFEVRRCFTQTNDFIYPDNIFN